jgi:hypothetical protein
MLIALFEPAMAQKTNNQTDTLLIKLEGRSQLLVTGKTFEDLINYKRADSLKSLFLADLAKATEAGVITGENRNVRYLVSSNGQRRIKAAAEPFTEEAFDLEKEKTRMNLDLPSYEYTIYDLAENVQMQFYLQDSTSISLIEKTNISEAIAQLKDRRDREKYYRIDVEKSNGQYNLTRHKGEATDNIQLSPVMGMISIGNKFSPTVGTTLKVNLFNKYERPSMRFGLDYTFSVLSDYSDGKFTNINVLTHYDLSWVFNLGAAYETSRWFGFEAGYIQGKNEGFKEGYKLCLVGNLDRVTIGVGPVYRKLFDTKTAQLTISLKYEF